MNGQELAFPFVETREMQGESISFGLTKREMFAAMAMQAQLSASDTKDTTTHGIAKWSVDYADALLAKLAKPTEATP